MAIRTPRLLTPFLLLLAAPSVPGQTRPPVGLREKVAVQLVQLNFLASDRSGKPVTDLRLDEIEILEKGKPQKVAFLEPYYQVPAARSAQGTPPSSPSAARSPSRWVLLLLDAYTSSPRTRVKSLEAIRTFVEQDLGPQDRAAIALFDGKLDFLQTFTGDRAALLQATSVPDSRLEHAAEDRTRSVSDLLEGMEDCRSKGTQIANCAQRLAAEYENSRHREARDFVYALTALTRALAPIPDLKAVVFFSDGFSREPFSDAFDAARASLGVETATRLSPNASGRLDRDLTELVAAATAAQVSFFTIFPGGGTGHSSVSAEHGDIPSERRNPENIDVYRRSEQNFGQGLMELARRTGGHSSQGNDVLKQLHGAWELSGGLYSAGYYLSDVRPSRSGEVKVRCQRKGVIIETRREAPIAHLEGGIQAGITTSSEVCESSRRSAHIEVSIDSQTLSYLPDSKEPYSDVSLYLSVLDPQTSTPLWEDYRYFRVAKSSEEPPRIVHTLRVPCRPLAIKAFLVDVGAGRRAELSADLPM